MSSLIVDMAQAGVVKYRKDRTTIGTLSGTYNFDQNLTLPPNTRIFAKVVRAHVTKQIPNFYNYGDTNNSTIGISIDAGATWIPVIIPDGKYDAREVTAALNDVANQNSWFTTPTDPGIFIELNTATGLFYTTLDNSKVDPVGFPIPPNGLGIRFDLSTAHNQFGYAGAQVFVNTTAGSVDYSADTAPKMDTQGLVCDVITNLQPMISYTNSKNTNVICSIPLTAGADPNIHEYPIAGGYTPRLRINNGGTLTGINAIFVTETGKELLVLYGDVNIEIEISTG